MAAYSDDTAGTRIDPRLWLRMMRRATSLRRRFGSITVIMILVAAVDAMFPVLYGRAIDRFVAVGSLEGIVGFSLTFVGLAAVQAVLTYLLVAIAGRIEFDVMGHYRADAFRHLQRLSIDYFDRTPNGWLITRLTSDVQRLGQTIAWGLVDVVWGVAVMVALGIAMLVIDTRLALWVLSVMPPLALASCYFQKRILRTQRRVRKFNSEISATFTEGIAGVVTTKTLVREAEGLTEFTALTGRMRTESIRAALYTALYLPVVVFLATVGTAVAVVVGGVGVTVGTITIGTVVTFVSYSVQFFEPVREVARVLGEFQAAQSAAERIDHLLRQDPTVVDRPEVTERYGDVLSPNLAAFEPAQGSIHFERVSFAYHPAEPVIPELDVVIPAGQSVALVGATGAGKSTIVNLIGRFYEPTSGRILIDGRDYRERSISWMQHQLGYVLQTPQLFRGTIRDNIRYGRLTATDDEIEAAARMVAADKVFRSLPGGYDYTVGESGQGLSVGQKQLVSFARAVLADPAIVILDEATSSIDTDTELRIQAAITSLIGGRTSIIIAHRLSTVRHADRILVLAGGRIVEDGTHATLLAKGGSYAQLHAEQFRAAG